MTKLENLVLLIIALFVMVVIGIKAKEAAHAAINQFTATISTLADPTHPHH